MPENVSSKLKEYLPSHILDLVTTAGEKADKTGGSLFLVGGIVRDLFLNRPNFDLDLVIEGDAIALAKELASSEKSKLTTHTRFNTAKLTFKDFSIDIATARRETYAHPGALPDVIRGKIEDDLIRRDFSINAMAVYLTPQRFGELIDFYHSREDLAAKQIRILHDNSFIDDATRIFRAIRYEQRLGFNLESHTETLLRRDIEKIDTLSGGRIRHEIELMLSEEYPEKTILRAFQLGVINKIHASIKADNWFAGKCVEARNVFKKTVLQAVYLSLLTYNLKMEEIEALLTKLNFPNKTAKTISQTIYLKAQLHRIETEYYKPSDIYQVLTSYDQLPIEINLLAAESPIIKKRLTVYLTELRHIKPLLTGEDLLKLGVPSGPDIGDVLNILYVAKLNGDVKTRQDEEKLVRDLLKDTNKSG